jgi:hypothetical protein
VTEETNGSPDRAGARPGPGAGGEGRRLKVVTDVFGLLWICPEDVDEDRDLAEQGGWRCGDTTREPSDPTPPDPSSDRSTQP